LGKKIVIADDEEDLVKFLKVRLLKRNYDVLTGTNGLEALDLVRQHRPDLVILDVKMPHLSGIEVCRRLKQDEALKAIPVILVTANSLEVTPEVFTSSQADDLMLKPFEASVLYEKLTRLIG
jgi:DNA-binding response OmpR family regulator